MTFAKPIRRRSLAGMLFLCWLLVATGFYGCASNSNIAPEDRADLAASLETEWGIRIEGVRLSAAGHLIDFRYRVTDAMKAEGMLRRGSEAFLIDEATGAKLPVPVTKVGQLRGTGTKPRVGRVYAVIFNNHGGVIKTGSSVTVVIADFRAEHLIVD